MSIISSYLFIRIKKYANHMKFSIASYFNKQILQNSIIILTPN